MLALKRFRRRAFIAALAAHSLLALPAESPREIEIATWNLEWLVTPRVFQQLKATCVPRDEPLSGSDRRLPCDVAFGKERAASDFSALARYARLLDADVIALQEVDGPAAARLVFRDHAFCFTGRRHLQNTGFAIRRGVPHRCGEDARALALDDRLRRGAELVLFPGTDRELWLLSIHLKSGCARDPLSSSRAACLELARQVLALEAWIDTQARQGRRFAVLGDFNRDLLREERERSSGGGAGTLWAAIDDGEPAEADLVNALAGARFRNCSAGQPFRNYIDFIVLSRRMGAALVAGSFQRITYEPADVWRFRLSDHCPIAVRIRP